MYREERKGETTYAVVVAKDPPSPVSRLRRRLQVDQLLRQLRPRRPVIAGSSSSGGSGDGGRQQVVDAPDVFRGEVAPEGGRRGKGRGERVRLLFLLGHFLLPPSSFFLFLQKNYLARLSRVPRRVP